MLCSVAGRGLGWHVGSVVWVVLPCGWTFGVSPTNGNQPFTKAYQHTTTPHFHGVTYFPIMYPLPVVAPAPWEAALRTGFMKF